MKINEEIFEKHIFNYVEKIKNLLSTQMWQKVLLDCSKNEILILWLLYKNDEVNMTQIAQYINTPLNTATGIISRMEKKNLVCRQRSIEDKRIVTIKLCENGREHIQSTLKKIMYYGNKILESFSQEEIELFFRMMNKLTDIMSEERDKENTKSKIRKISID